VLPSAHSARQETIMTMTLTKEPTSRVEDTIRKIRALRLHTTMTGFKTGRAQNDLLGVLNSEELAEVVLALQQK
jgi:hypothetical protein